ncbi:MAG TPA: alpha/beta fold hydrolase [Solirubrobacteraceae bacterium]|nr:alpha/beta fold hydrolase [Solirubrobacteraceae bacterium]
MKRHQSHPPVPPRALPPARTVIVPGRGEFFLRDTGGEGAAVLLLHGWMATADLNWAGAYSALAEAGHRVLAIDHRGHGRGLRSLVPFRLADCAADAAGVLRVLDTGPATIVGYSMGGAIAQIFAREHAELAAGVVLGGTAQHWQDPPTQRRFRALGLLGLGLSVAPRQLYHLGLARSGIPEGESAAWLESELLRHSARDIAEAGRELGRFDSRSWLSTVEPKVAVLVTLRDELVAPGKQRELAAAAGGPVVEADISHMQVVERAGQFNPPLLEAITVVSGAYRSAPSGTLAA